ncbi:hypothetical protein [Pseudoclavibacter sp. Z016]|uniref:hypothetical protein n=1 Tax=Pseudoclavibacter sp. Z016 TaxID=2080581 RepID=UPI000CE8D0C2|nr:hypothetical protein [Pseudoclavibacter sp. Z016]PPF74918.1 hypothetical protein C5B99_12270 [Pseudoclavibacter sp. Z016]
MPSGNAQRRPGNTVGGGNAARRGEVSHDTHEPHRTAGNQLRKLDQQWAAEDHQALVAWFTGNPDMAARELPELEELVTAATESGHPPAAALLGMAVLVTDATIRIADAATLDPVTGRLDRAAAEGYLAALDLWIGPPLDGADRKPVKRTQDLFGNETGRAHRIEE